MEAFQGLAQLLADGSVRAIGTSELQARAPAALFDATGLVPRSTRSNWIRGTPASDLRGYPPRHGIVTESWSPLGQRRGPAPATCDPEIAWREKYGKTPAQVVLRWHTQSGHVPIPKSSHPDRQAENLAVFDFELDQADMGAIAELDRGESAVTDAEQLRALIAGWNRFQRGMKSPWIRMLSGLAAPGG